MIKWQKAPYGINGWFTDVNGIGRYYIKREFARGPWRAYLNNKSTTFTSRKLEDVQSMVERSVRAMEM